MQSQTHKNLFLDFSTTDCTTLLEWYKTSKYKTIYTMSTFKDRLQTEETELSEKIEKLGTFLNSPTIETIDSIQVSLLGIQIRAMKTYRECLTQRLKTL